MSSQVPVYLAELSPGRIRGRVVGIQQWAIEWGILIMYLISYGCSKMEGPSSFRLAWGLQGIPAFVLLGALFFFPESPRWLASKDRWEECLNVLALLHGQGDPQHPVAQAEYLEGKHIPFLFLAFSLTLFPQSVKPSVSPRNPKSSGFSASSAPRCGGAPWPAPSYSCGSNSWAAT